MKPLRALLVCLLLPCAAQAADAPKIEQFSLANGMQVVVIPNHRVPAVNHMLWFRVGAIEDPTGKSGLAHYHEHMMFDGTAHYKKGEYSDIIERHGGKQNAFTGHDATAYWVNIAKDQLPLVMELEADRLRGLEPTDEDALKERDVIIEERRMRVDNSPRGLFSEQMGAALYLNHPYHTPIIGWQHEMAGLSKQDVLEFHKHYYHAGNALLIVSGDITAAEFRPLAEKYYGVLPKGPAVVRDSREEPPHLAPRRLTMQHALVKQPAWQREYLAPGILGKEKEDVLPLFVLQHILGGGETSRLYQALVVKQKITANVGASYDGLNYGPGEFTISATPLPNVAMEKVEAAVDHELARVIKDGVTDEEISRAKTLLKADTIYEREGLQGVAYSLGWFMIIGLPADDYLKWPERIDTVTPAQVQAAANRLFNLRRSVTGVLLPEEKNAQ